MSDVSAPTSSVAEPRFGSSSPSLAGDAHDLGCEAELEWVNRILERGNGAQRQLLVYGTNRDAVDVARDIAEITAR